MVRRICFVAAVIMAWSGFAIFSAEAQAGRTFYVDYAAGSNSNNGTSKSTPWKTHPYMQTSSGCTGNESAPAYSHQAGDSFIFKGGITWPAACFGMNIGQGGTSGTNDYFGVDVNWFNGGSFSRPIFDLAHTAPAATGPAGGRNVIYVGASNITLDNLEIKNQFITGGHGGPDIGYDCGVFFDYGSLNNLVENGYFHDWSSTQSGLVAGFSNCAGGIGVSGGRYSADKMEIGDPQGSPVRFGGCFANPTEVKNSKCHDVSQGVNGFGSVHDSEFYNITDIATRSPYSNGIHTNDIQQTWPGGSGSVYNNLIHDSSAGQHLGVCPTANVYNNVMWNIGGGSSAPIGVDSGINACTVNSSTVMNIYNNTVDCTGGLPNCISIGRNGAAFGSVNVKNNHFIVNSGQNVIANTAAPASLNQSNNVIMTSSVAAAQGYTKTNLYAPTASTNGTVNAATSLSAACSNNMSALCADRLHNPRPSSWDAGAYEFGGQSQSTRPDPPTNLFATIQ